MSEAKVKLDDFNKKIITVLHHQADLSNQELAEQVGLSASACFQRVKALKEAGYFKALVTELDLDRICEHLLAFVEFKLENNSLASRRLFEKAVEQRPEFMDCLHLSDDMDYVCFTCCSNIQELNALCDDISADETLGIKTIKTRIILDRVKWYLGYPLSKMRWLD